jgi:cell surface protein SprA
LVTNYQDFNQNFTVSNKVFKATGQCRFVSDLKIDLTADRSLSENYSEQYDVSAGRIYNSRSPYNYGLFSVSTVIKTSFSVSNEISSVAFDDLEQIDSQSRTDSLLRGIDVNNPANLDAEGYPVGKKTQFYYQRF